MHKEQKVSVIVPCYNEEAVIETTYIRLRTALEQSTITNYELIFIDDGSLDETARILRTFSTEDKTCKILLLSRNFGHQKAVTAGLHRCTGDVAIIIDADLQDPPELIPQLVDKYNNEDCNVIYCVRTQREGETFFKKFTAKLYYRIINSISEIPLPKDSGDFRLIDRAVIDEFNRLREKNKYIRGLITWIGFKQVPFYYERQARFAGETKYPFFKMLNFATNALLYFTKKPLTLAVVMGLLCTLVGLFLAAYVIAGRIFFPERLTDGWASTMIVIIFFGGVQLLSTGLLGKYIGSVFDEVKDRPDYIIKEIIN